MKQPPLPSITKVEEVLDLLTDPEKYIQYLKDLKTAHDLATASLANVDTKEKADSLLSQAIQASNDIERERVSFLQDITKQRAEFAQELKTKRADLDQKVAFYNDREAELSKKEKALQTAEVSFFEFKTKTEDTLSIQTVDMLAERAKLAAQLKELADKRAKAEATLKALE